MKRESQVKLALMKSRLHTAIEKTEPFVNMWRKAKEVHKETNVLYLKQGHTLLAAVDIINY